MSVAYYLILRYADQLSEEQLNEIMLGILSKKKHDKLLRLKGKNLQSPVFRGWMVFDPAERKKDPGLCRE